MISCQKLGKGSLGKQLTERKGSKFLENASSSKAYVWISGDFLLPQGE